MNLSRSNKLTLIKSAILVALFLFSCSGGDEIASPPLPDWVDDVPQSTEFSLPMFSADSVWNTPIGENPAVDPDSAVMVAQILKDVNQGANPVLSVHHWSVTVFFADENTSRIDVALRSKWWQEYDYLLNVPMPENAIPDPNHDGHMAIIDETTGFLYEFWQAEKLEDGDWIASWGNRIPLNSDGIYPYGMSSRGSGFSVMAGVIWPQEFQTGIQHALILSIPSTKKGGPVPPATETDGLFGFAGAIPEGARLQLNPDLDLDAYDLTSYERAICKALQTFGAFVGDTSGSIEFEAVNPLSFLDDPYLGLFNEEWIILENIPLEELRVLSLPAQVDDPPLMVVEEEIYQ